MFDTGAVKRPELRRTTAIAVCPHCGGKLPAEFGSRAGVRYALRRRGGLWRLVFAGEESLFKHEKGAEYVARLLAEGGPFHALELVGRVGGRGGRRGGGKGEEREAVLKEVLEVGGIVQERSASLDEQESRQTLMEQRRRLAAIAKDEKAPALKRATAPQDIKAIEKFLRSQPHRPTDEAQRAVRAVRMAIKRFYRNLLAAVDEGGRRDRVLNRFADHLEKHLLIPSGRYSGARARQARGEMAGSFVYERPGGVVWGNS